MRLIRLVLVVIIVTFLKTGAVIAMDKTDLMVGMKTLPLLNNKITGSIKIAIVFDPNQHDSKLEAETVKSLIDSGLELPGDLSADAVMIPVSQLEKMASVKIAIITSNLVAYYNQISNAATQYKILTMSTDLDCVQHNKCVLGIISKPRVEIYYSKIAAANSEISFGQAFTTLIKPVP